MYEHEILKRYQAGERDFSGLELEECHLSERILIGINLSNANFKMTSFIGTHLDKANLSRANLPGADLWAAYAIDADLSYANLASAELSYANLNGANLTGANLTGGNLTGGNLTGANLTDIITTEETIFHYTTAKDGNVIKDSNRGLDAKQLLSRYAIGDRNFENVILHRVDLSGTELRDVDMHWASFSHVNLSNTTLTGSWKAVRFINCDLRRAILRNCDLTNTLFIYVNLRGAKISGNITCTNFIEVNLLDATFTGYGESLPFYYNVTLEDGFFLTGPSNYRQRPS